MDASTLAGLIVIISVALFFDFTNGFHDAANAIATSVSTRAILGAGATHRLSAVRWGVAGNIVTAWVLTLPGAGLIAAVSYWILHAIVRV